MNAPRPFAHLHCHSQFSMLDGANRLPDLVAKVKAEGMNSVAITDHGNLCGAFEFYNLCKSEGIKPIVGYEAYVAPGNRRDRGATKMKEASFHLTLLAMNRTGYFNLVKLASMAFLEGFYYRPRIDKEILKAHSEGLICLSGCAASELSQYLLGERMDDAKKLIEWYIATFGDRFYMEIQNAGLDIQKQCMDPTVDLARQYGLPLVATNDAHYLNKEDAAAHDVLLCVSTRSTVNDEKRMRMDCDQFYVRTPEEMYAAFPGFEEAVKQSQLIADRVDIELEKNPKHYPRFTAPDNLTDTQYLRKLCEERLPLRYGDNITDAIRARLDLELATIDKMGYSSYFLIVWDFVRFAEENDIPCGARGSACGAMVAYLLGLSHVCPLEYDLLFERFLDASRTEPPDIDIDFCRDGRQKVIDYTKAKYGIDNVCQIGTFGTLKAKLAIRDVGRALGIPLARVDQIAKSVPDELNIKLKDAIEQAPDLKDAYAADPEIKKLLDIAQKLEGLTRNVGTHAAGVVVSDAPIDNYIPLQTISGKEDVITQWDGPHVEKAGLLKMDFLGLRNLTILHKAVQNVRKHRGEIINTIKLPLDDQKTFELLQRGETKGVFQFESGGIRDLLTKMRPDKFADIIATSALYRPGPLEGGMVMDYVDVKHGRKPPAKVHPLVDAVLEETYGVMVYQEQVMRILNRVGGIELADAYKCIKAISKKKEKIIAGYYDEYVKGAVQRGVEQQVAIDLFELIKKFAGYGFNKCVVGSTVIVDAKTGERATVKDLFDRRRRFSVHALAEDWKLKPRRVTDVVWNGRKRVYRVTTSQGRQIVATANHPFRTFAGWTNLADLKIGARVAAPRALSVSASESWPDHELIVLAGLLSEGNTCHPSSLYFHNNQRDFIEDFATAADQFPDSVARIDARRDGRLEVCVNTGRDARFQNGQTPWNAGRQSRESKGGAVAVAAPPKSNSLSGCFRWAQRLGITGKLADQKFVPEPVFHLNDLCLELFLGRLWSGDGFVGASGQMPYYATSSRRLAQDVSLLLLRLGIQGGIHRKVMKYRYRGESRDRIGYTVHLVGRDSIERFLERIGPHIIGRDEQLADYREYLAAAEPLLTSKDTIPADIRHWVNEERQSAGLKWRDLESQSGVCVRELCRRANTPNKKGFRRDTISRLADFLGSPRLQHAADADVFWDTIVAIEPAGIEDTYDLTVERDHNFVADGLIVHNSHSTAYGAVSYQTAYLKAHYPAEFMAALLTCGMEDSDRISEHTDDARRMGIKIVAPDINTSDTEFAVVDDKTVSFGMAAIKGLGEAAVKAIVAERTANGPFKDIFDIAERLDPKVLQKATLEILIKAGALDSLGPNRAQHMAAVERAVAGAAARQKDKQRGQKNLFGGDDEPAANEPTSQAGGNLPDAPDWTHSQKLSAEKEVLGFFLTSHPLTQFADKLTKHTTHENKQLGDLEDGTEVLVAGMIGSIKKAQTKKPSRNGHSKYVNFDLEDPTGIVRCIMWPEDYARLGDKVQPEAVVFLKGKVDRRSREPNLIVNQLFTVEEADKNFTTQIAINFKRGLHGEREMTRTKQILESHPGKTDVILIVDTPDPADPSQHFRYVLSTPSQFKVSCNADLQTSLNEVLGREHIQLIAPPKETRMRSMGGASIGR